MLNNKNLRLYGLILVAVLIGYVLYRMYNGNLNTETETETNNIVASNSDNMQTSSDNRMAEKKLQLDPVFRTRMPSNSSDETYKIN